MTHTHDTIGHSAVARTWSYLTGVYSSAVRLNGHRWRHRIAKCLGWITIFSFQFFHFYSGFDLRLGQISPAAPSDLQDKRWSLLQRERLPPRPGVRSHSQPQRKTRAFIETNRYERSRRRSNCNVPEEVCRLTSNSLTVEFRLILSILYFQLPDSIGSFTSFSLCCCQSTPHWNIGMIRFKRHYSLHSLCAI